MLLKPMEYFVLSDMDFSEKRVFVRCDFNVPLDDKLNISNDRRIRAALPTISYILEKGAKQVILASHLGKPQKDIKKGKSAEEVRKKLSLAPVAKRLAELLEKDVAALQDCVDVEMPDSRLVLLENLRFHEEEESKDDSVRDGFAKKLAGYADLYVNDAFGTCHRKHASVYDITKYLKSAAGLLVEQEIRMMEPVRDNPKKPFALLLGGAKVEDKIKVVETMYEKLDMILIGGAMAFAFFKAQGHEVGKSLCEGVDIAQKILDNYSDKITLPVDVVLDDETVADYDKMPAEKSGLDIGPKTVGLFKEKIKNAKTVFWNGPFGLFEKKPFEKSTAEIAEYLAGLCKKGATIVIGGGDTAAAMEELNLQDKFTHVSTGGGASLEFFQGEELPAIKALKENYQKFS